MIKICSLDFDDAVALVPFSNEASRRTAHGNGEPGGPNARRPGRGHDPRRQDRDGDEVDESATAPADLEMFGGREALSVGVPYPVAKSDPFRLASVATLMADNNQKRDA